MDAEELLDVEPDSTIERVLADVEPDSAIEGALVVFSSDTWHINRLPTPIDVPCISSFYSDSSKKGQRHSNVAAIVHSIVATSKDRC